MPYFARNFLRIYHKVVIFSRRILYEIRDIIHLLKFIAFVV